MHARVGECMLNSHLFFLTDSTLFKYSQEFGLTLTLLLVHVCAVFGGCTLCYLKAKSQNIEAYTP